MSISTTYTSGFRYRTARPDEYIIKSGLGVGQEAILKNTFQWPFQRVTTISLAPRNYSFDLHMISKDLVPFTLPVVFTIGPFDPAVDVDSFRRYASKMSAMTEKELHEVVLGIIHGQTRLYAAGLTVIEMFGDRDSFKQHVQERIGKELLGLGLNVFNGNVAEMRDVEGNAYFSSLKQKAISSAVNDARIEVATAKKRGDTGESANAVEAKVRMAEIKKDGDISEQRAVAETKIGLAEIQKETEIGQADSRAAKDIRVAEINKGAEIGQAESKAAKDIRVAELDASVVESQNARKQQIEKSRLELELVNLACKRDEGTKRVEADMAPKTRQAELQTELNKLDAAKQIEFLRATELAQTTVAAEGKIKEAEAEATALRLGADAALYVEQQKAEGIRVTMEAKAAGLRDMLAAGTPDLVRFYLSLENGLFVQMADKTAQAIQGLQPKINVWTTGGASGDEFSPLQKLFTGLPPMLEALQQQTDVKLPSWMPQAGQAMA